MSPPVTCPVCGHRQLFNGVADQPLRCSRCGRAIAGPPSQKSPNPPEPAVGDPAFAWKLTKIRWSVGRRVEVGLQLAVLVSGAVVGFLGGMVSGYMLSMVGGGGHGHLNQPPEWFLGVGMFGCFFGLFPGLLWILVTIVLTWLRGRHPRVAREYSPKGLP